MLTTFRTRLGEVITASGLNRSQFAVATDLDRSTLSQLLAPTNRRLPRVDTLVGLAEHRQVSIDWLLGLTHGGPMGAELMREQASFELDALAPNDERLIQWYHEAVGYKVRYVPSSLPDLLKTPAVIRHELSGYAATRPEQKIETAGVRLAWTQDHGGDLECCSSRQSLEGFARGEGMWRTMPRRDRLEQLEQIATLTDELYPGFRWFLFDAVARYAVPVTVFGQQRAALYLGQMYLVLTSAEHVRTLTGQFEDLVRAAVVQPPDVPALARSLLDEAVRSRPG